MQIQKVVSSKDDPSIPEGFEGLDFIPITEEELRDPKGLVTERLFGIFSGYDGYIVRENRVLSPVKNTNDTILFLKERLSVSIPQNFNYSLTE